jgi:hypothetical protein
LVLPEGHYWWALLGFVAITLVLTWPIGLELGSAVLDLGDPLLNSWIWSWQVYSLSHLGEVGFFDTNIFYPHRNTLAYSELLLPQLVIAAPAIWASGNPVLAHNLVLLASFVATAMATYLLALYWTGNRPASFTAGLILAFCPFMFNHLAHVQLILAAGIPLAFLFLHRFLDRGRTVDATLFALFFSLQALANTYYAVYLSLFAGLYLAAQVSRRRLWKQRRFWLQSLLIAGIVAALVWPFYWHYFQLKQEMGFSRFLTLPASISSYVATPATNHLYGEFTRSLSDSETRLFPGFVALALAAVGLSGHLRRSGEKRMADRTRAPSPRRLRWIFRIIDWLIVATAGTMVLLSFGLAVHTQLGPVPFHLESVGNPALILILLLAARGWIRHRWPRNVRAPFLRLDKPALPILLVTAFVLSLGTAPYLFLYRWVPGFDSLRAVTRISVMFMFALALLSAEGLVLLLRRLPSQRRRWVAIVIPALILIEYFSAPIPLVSAPQPSEFPAVYRWLADREDDPVFIAYPLHLRDERLRVYYSTQHRRNMVNGYSGFFPPLYKELRSKGRFFPRQDAVDDLQRLGVDLVFVDLEARREKRRNRIRSTLDEMHGLERIATFENTLVYQIQRHSEPPRPPATPARDLVALDSTALTLRASTNQPSLFKLRDGDRQTRWRSPMLPGEWLELEWPQTRVAAALQLDISGQPQSYPRGYRLEMSQDGDHWQVVEEVREFHPPITDFLRPTDFVLRFDLPARQIRFLRFVQTGESAKHPWTVAEVNVLIEPS